MSFKNSLLSKGRAYNTFDDSDTPPAAYMTTNVHPPPVALNNVAIDIHEMYNTEHNFPIQLKVSGNRTPDQLIWCERCRKMYKENENKEDSCSYHPGIYKDPGGDFSMLSYVNFKRWTCCKKETQNAEGCQKASHKEDSIITGILSNFQTGDAASPSKSVTPKPKEKLKEPPPSPPPKIVLTADGFISHEVQKTDTLEGLALKYNVTVPEIKKTNKMFANAITHKFLKIPVRDNVQ